MRVTVHLYPCIHFTLLCAAAISHYQPLHFKFTLLVCIKQCKTLLKHHVACASITLYQEVLKQSFLWQDRTQVDEILGRLSKSALATQPPGFLGSPQACLFTGSAKH